MQKLVGSRFELTVSDPWEFVTNRGANFSGVVAGVEGDSLILTLESPIDYEAIHAEKLLASLRHEGRGFRSSEAVAVSIIPIAKGYSPVEARAKWRGWSLVGVLAVG